MTETRLVVACGPSQRHWYPDQDAPDCADPAHDHQRFDVHVHCDVVQLPDGAQVMAASYDSRHPYVRERPPDHGVYLDRRWEPPWPHDLLEWPDFGVPEDPDVVHRALRSLVRRAHAGQVVEVGCLGGHGRTGTAIACMAVLAGQPADDAVCWTRTTYCEQAVETPAQESFVVTFAERLRRS